MSMKRRLGDTPIVGEDGPDEWEPVVFPAWLMPALLFLVVAVIAGVQLLA